MEKTDNVLVLQFEGIRCEICGQEGQIRATGKGKVMIKDIKLDIVQLKCAYCQTEYLMPVFFLARDRKDARKRLSLIRDIDSSLET